MLLDPLEAACKTLRDVDGKMKPTRGQQRATTLQALLLLSAHAVAKPSPPNLNDSIAHLH